MALLEFPSKNDFYLKFKAIYNEEDKFIDYILIDISKNTNNIINYKSSSMLGKKISEIVLNDENNLLGLENLYYQMIPKARRKFEIYLEELKAWYLVNIIGDKGDDLMIFYTDVNRYKKDSDIPPNKSSDTFEESSKKCM